MGESGGVRGRSAEKSGVSLPAAECAFVDDIEWNVRAALGLDIAGVHHVDAERQRGWRAFGVSFR
jgi:FMN phosphatase YigB (HAD superfamily)